MALPIGGTVLLDTTVFIDFLRADGHAKWILRNHGTIVRFISVIVLRELRHGADTPTHKNAVDRLQHACSSERTHRPDAIRFLTEPDGSFKPCLATLQDYATGFGPCMNDLLIAHAARKIGITVVTGNVLEYPRIAAKVSGLKIVEPQTHSRMGNGSLASPTAFT